MSPVYSSITVTRCGYFMGSMLFKQCQYYQAPRYQFVADAVSLLNQEIKFRERVQQG